MGSNSKPVKTTLLFVVLFYFFLHLLGKLVLFCDVGVIVAVGTSQISGMDSAKGL
jgi:formate hydrogenlyase subunit 3/multisubunit Na+/H+ antiporter MnhD subunit